MIGIIGAMDEEIEVMKSMLENVSEKTIASVKFYTGSMHNKDVVLMLSGIGKVNAAVSTTLLLTHFPVEYVINIGTAGGVKAECNVLDIVVSDRVMYHDVDVTAFNYQYGQIPHMPVSFTPDSHLIELAEIILKREHIPYHKGLIVSGDVFVHEEKQINNIKEHLSDITALEMEASAISQVCFIFNRPFLILRSLSDIAGKKSGLSFDEYVEKASLNAANVVSRIIEKL